jgi:hypothetical protein
MEMISAYKHKEVFIMTKLFSMKSLAFAGAAAFALTLAAAPQADAAQVTATVDYEEGTLTVNANGNKLTSTDDGSVIYYQSGKAQDKLSTKKYTAVALPSDNKIDISNLMGKETYIAVSTKGTDDPTKMEVETATGIAIAASPKIKAEFSATDTTINLTDKGEIVGNIASGSSVGFKAQVKKGAYGKWVDVTDTTVSTAANEAKALGTTLYIRVAYASGSTQTSPWSKEAKVKISAQAKAPKVTLDLAATKAFTTKISDKQEYKISVGDAAAVPAGWKTGSKMLLVGNNSLKMQEQVQVLYQEMLLCPILHFM